MIRAEPDASPSLPYYRPGAFGEIRSEPVYRWPAGTKAGIAFERPPAVAHFEAVALGVPIRLTVPVEFRTARPDFGEIRSDLAVLPAVSVNFDPPMRVVGRAGWDEPVEVAVVLENFSGESFRGVLAVDPVRGNGRRSGGALAELSVELAPGESRRYALELPSRFEGPGVIPLTARWLAEDGSGSPAYSVYHLDYDHIRSRFLSRPAGLRLDLMDVTLPDNLRVGYVQGSGDQVGEVLAQLGAEVIGIDDEALSKGDLSRYDAIVLGVRAYEVRGDLAANNDRLLDYARAGGTVIVQYNKYEFDAGEFAPFPMSMARPHDRVTDENAEIVILDGDHPIFRYPNRITVEDFSGWIQERGLYFWSRWDERYTPLLESADPGEEPKRGGMMFARVGRGNYIYTGYAFFRQLPAGVEGAARLFANLVSLGRAP